MSIQEEESFNPVQARAERLFEQEDIIHKARLIESDYKDSVLALIAKENLSAHCKIALAGLIGMAFDRNVILANNQTLELRKLDFEKALNKTQLCFSRSDVMNKSLPPLLENIRQAFIDFVSRSYKMGERERQGERRTVQKIDYTNPAEQNSQPKRGFGLNPFRNKDGENE